MRTSLFLLSCLLLLFMAAPLAGAAWEDVETWETTVTAGYWSDVDTWVTTLNIEAAPPVFGWEDVATWTTTITSEEDIKNWIDVDTWETTISSVAVPVTPSSIYDFSLSIEDILTKTHLAGVNAVFGTAQTVCTNSWDASTSLTIGMSTGATYNVRRGFLPLDLSELTSEISDASLYLTGSVDWSTTDFNLIIVEGTESDILQDNTSFNGYNTTVLGTWNTSSFLTTSRGIKIDFTPAGITFLNDNLGNEVVLCLISEEDLNDSAPTDNEYVSFKNVLDADTEKRPVLYYNTVGGTVWYDVDTWTTTIEIEEEPVGPGPGEPSEPLIPMSKLISIITPLALLFSPAFAFMTAFRAMGFIVGLAVGLFLLWMTGYITLGMVVLGGMAIAAIYFRSD